MAVRPGCRPVPARSCLAHAVRSPRAHHASGRCRRQRPVMGLRSLPASRLRSSSGQLAACLESALFTGALAVLAPRPAAGPALALLQLLLGPADAALSGHLLLGILDPA